MLARKLGFLFGLKFEPNRKFIFGEYAAKISARQTLKSTVVQNLPKPNFVLFKFHFILFIWILKIFESHCLVLNDVCMSYTNIKKEIVWFNKKNT